MKMFDLFFLPTKNLRNICHSSIFVSIFINKKILKSLKRKKTKVIKFNVRSKQLSPQLIKQPRPFKFKHDFKKK